MIKKSFLEDNVRPLKTEYLIFGALIILFSFLKDLFETEIIRFSLLGLVVFVVFIVLISIILKTIKIHFTKNTSLEGAIYLIFLLIFFLFFFAGIYNEHSVSFFVFLGLTLGFLTIKAFMEVRIYLDIIDKWLRANFLKKIFRALVFIIATNYLLKLFFFVAYSSRIFEYEETCMDLAAITTKEMFYMAYLSTYWVVFIVLFFAFFIDIFRKNPIGSKNRRIEQSTIYQFIKGFWKVIREVIQIKD